MRLDEQKERKREGGADASGCPAHAVWVQGKKCGCHRLVEDSSELITDRWSDHHSVTPEPSGTSSFCQNRNIPKLIANLLACPQNQQERILSGRKCEVRSSTF